MAKAVGVSPMTHKEKGRGGWMSTAPQPLKLDEDTELVLNIDASYKERYRERVEDAEEQLARGDDWQVVEEGPRESEGPWSYQVIRVIDRTGAAGATAGASAPASADTPAPAPTSSGAPAPAPTSAPAPAPVPAPATTCVRVLGCTDDTEHIEAPAQLGGLPVWDVGTSAFAHMPALRSIKLPDTVRHVGRKAFFCDFNLEEVLLSDAICVLDETVFEQCRGIRHIHLPARLQALPARLLWDSSVLTSLETPPATGAVSLRACRFGQLEQITVHPDNPYMSTDGSCLFSVDGTVLLRALFDMRSYRVPETCRAIAANAFKSMRTLRSVQLPDGLQSIGERAFYHTGLVRVQLPEGLERVEAGAFALCQTLGNVTFPSTLQELGEEAFAKSKLGQAHLPAALKSIGRGCFDGTQIRFGNANSFSIAEENPALFTDQVALYSSENGVQRLVSALVEHQTYKVAEGTREIADGAFSGLRGIGKIELPEGLLSIGARAFEGCTGLRRVDFPDSLENIGERAFFESGLRKVVVGPKLRSIGPLALATAGADFARKLTAPGLIVASPENERYYVENQVLCERREDGDVAIAAENQCGKLRIPEQVQVIGDLAFAKVSAHDLYIHAGIRRVNVRGFLNIEDLERVHICFPREVDGVDSATMLLPHDQQKARWYLSALRMDSDGLFFDFDAYDLLAAQEQDPYDVATLVLDRLDHPIKLTNAAREGFATAVKRVMSRLAQAAMQKRDMRMFERLADHGYLNEGNIDDIIEKSAAWREAEATAYLLEMKHRRFTIEADEDFSF